MSKGTSIGWLKHKAGAEEELELPLHAMSKLSDAQSNGFADASGKVCSDGT
jgi:hypothetical protein